LACERAWHPIVALKGSISNFVEGTSWVHASRQKLSITHSSLDLRQSTKSEINSNIATSISLQLDALEWSGVEYLDAGGVLPRVQVRDWEREWERAWDGEWDASRKWLDRHSAK